MKLPPSKPIIFYIAMPIGDQDDLPVIRKLSSVISKLPKKDLESDEKMNFFYSQFFGVKFEYLFNANVSLGGWSHICRVEANDENEKLLFILKYGFRQISQQEFDNIFQQNKIRLGRLFIK